MTGASRTDNLKEVKRALLGVVRAMDPEEHSFEERLLGQKTEQLLIEVIEYNQVYELSETRADQLAAGQEARQRVDQLTLQISQGLGHLFDPASVAHLGALLDDTKQQFE